MAGRESARREEKGSLPYASKRKRLAAQKRYREKKRRLGYRLTWVSQKTPHYDPIYGAKDLPMKIKRKRPAGYHSRIMKGFR